MHCWQLQCITWTKYDSYSHINLYYQVPTAIEEETKGQSGGEEDLQYNSPTPSSQESSQEVGL